MDDVVLHSVKEVSVLNTKMATVVTNDGSTLNLNSKLVEKCKMLSMILEDCDSGDRLPLTNVDRVTMERIIEFDKTGKLSHHDDMITLMLACDYLNFDELLDYAAHIVADNLKGKSAKEIRRFLSIQEPTPVPV